MVNENKIRILYVQPGKYPEERFVANELHPLQRLVGGDIQAVYPWSKDKVALICNDSGKVDGLPLNRCIEDYDVIAGNFFTWKWCGWSAATPVPANGWTGSCGTPPCCVTTAGSDSTSGPVSVPFSFGRWIGNTRRKSVKRCSAGAGFTTS